ncbi:hypothetical protein CI109_106726 [Kwoniella shandongensis]|uniref:Uncharacterized protein n=1 Tax=Kwoniella shandongensis TaxID=1734106 RepID=A0A5M6C6V0_9TREE|nr:uncharacterized protein CI109_001018 [Kwoniella shandongensis]KAA5530838.1 hypothetical protein CI109_001018 [Kwoniella shandongensis]
MAPPPGLTFREKVRYAFSSPGNFNRAITLESAKSKYINEDLVPSPPERWTWTAWSYLAYWWSESWNVSTWSVGSSLVALGLSVGEALLVVLFANILSAVIIVMNGFAAARYHIGYPVLARATFGMYGHYFFVAIRAILGIIWGGVQLYFEGQFISIMLRCIFPSWETMKNTIPESQGITLQVFIGFLVAFIVTMPFMLIHTTKIRHLFAVKSFVMPIAGLGIVIWATKANGGVSSGAIESVADKSSTIVFAFSVIAQFNSVMGSNSALIVTVPDLARYSRKPRDQVWGQLIGLPVSILCAAFGVITTSAVQNMWGKAYWNPYDLLNGILDQTYSSKSRAGVFFAAMVFAFATLGTSIACNITPFAADVTCMLPKYINIVRGQFLCLIIAFAITPWHILTSAPTFLNFLGGYSIFQGSVVSIMLVDYFLIRRGNLDIPAMYDESTRSKYYFVWGVNWRSIAAFVIGFLLPLPGFIGSFGTVSVSVTATRLYDLGWELSFLCGGVAYYVLCLVFKVPGQEDCKRPFGEMSDDEWTLPDGEKDTRFHMHGVEQSTSRVEDYDEKHVDGVTRVHVV